MATFYDIGNRNGINMWIDCNIVSAIYKALRALPQLINALPQLSFIKWFIYVYFYKFETNAYQHILLNWFYSFDYIHTS